MQQAFKFECTHMAVHNLIKKSRKLGSQSVIKEAVDLLLQQQKKTLIFWELVVCKKMNLVPTIPQGEFFGYWSANHQFIAWSRNHCYKRLKTPQMNSACHKTRAEYAGKFLQRFSNHSLPQLMFQDEKDFSLQVPTNHQNNQVCFNGPKNDVQPERLYSEGN